MIYHFEDFTLDTDRFELRRGEQGCPLEPQVFELLRYLVEHHDRMVTKDEILDHIWPERYITEAALNSRVMAARKAVGDSGEEQRLIKTVRGRGFRFLGEVRAADDNVDPRGAGSAAAGEKVTPPPVQYATTEDGFSIAYATYGEGPPLVRVPGWVTHLDLEWRWPNSRRFWERLAERYRLVRYDGRGFGLSDAAEEFSVETSLADLSAVMDALSLDGVTLLGTSALGVIAAVRYSASHPDRVKQLITLGGGTEVANADENIEWVRDWHMQTHVIRMGWGRDTPVYRELHARMLLGDDARAEDIAAMTELHRVASPARRAARYVASSVDPELPEIARTVQVPTLVAHRRGDTVPIARARRLAQLIPGARLLVLDGDSHWMLDRQPGTDEFIEAVHGLLGDQAEAS